MTLIVDKLINIDRPDIVKKQGTQSLTFKEIKDALFKFLMQVNLRFVGFDKISIPSVFKPKGCSEPEIYNTSFYTTTCKLLDITVDKKPVYIITIPETRGHLNKRQYNKIIYLKQYYNIVVFDSNDCRGVGLDLSDKAWLDTLNKSTLRKWSKLLYKRIAELGQVESKVSLNDLYSHIEMSSPKTGASRAMVVRLKEESAQLKKKFIINRIDYYLSNSNKTFPNTVLEYLSTIDIKSSKWIEDIINFSIYKCISRIDKRRNYYKDFFRLKNGEISFVNKEKLSELLLKTLSKNFKVTVTSLGYGALKIQDNNTFQTLYLVLEATYSRKISGTKLSSNLLKILGANPFYHLHLTFDSDTDKVTRTRCSIFLLDSKDRNRFTQYNKYKMLVFDSKEMKSCNLNLLE